MKKIISYSLYKAPENWEQVMNTSFSKYVSGIEKNLSLIDKHYPDWHVYIYHNASLDKKIISQFSNETKVKFIEISDLRLNAMQWRFLPCDDEDVELFISRDIDSRITEREKVSVQEWIESDKILHIMRDHPHHGYEILGGMWGMKSQNNFNIKKSCIEYNESKNYNFEKDWYEKWWDMNYLSEVLYPKFKDSSYVNASYHCMEPWCKPFTLEMVDKHFIGEIFKENNERDYQYTLL